MGLPGAQVRGWINYYGAFYRSELCFLAKRIDEHIVRWAMQKFKRLRKRPVAAWAELVVARQRQPLLFAHWHLIASTNSRPVGTGDFHVGFYERRGVRFPPALTRYGVLITIGCIGRSPSQ